MFHYYRYKKLKVNSEILKKKKTKYKIILSTKNIN